MLTFGLRIPTLALLLGASIAVFPLHAPASSLDPDSTGLHSAPPRTDSVTSVGKEQAARDTSVSPEHLMPFSGWKVINLPTGRTLEQGNWLFLISHRFNQAVNVGYSGFYGLDSGATMDLSLGYAFTDRLLATVSRSDLQDNVELETRYGIVHETAPDSPVGLSVQGSLNWRTQKVRGESRWRSERVTYTGQVTLTRTIAGQLGFALVPGVTLNPSPDLEGEAPILTLGLGGRWKLQEKLALVGEWTPILSRPDEIVGRSNRYSTWAAGVEVTTAGHVFQIVASNNLGLSTNQYLGGGDLNGDVFDGAFRLGFNIFRILDFSKF